jgi:outer membrane protein OmpA-like peptidoglycan-associated protein
MKKYFLLASIVGLFLTTNLKAQETAKSEEFSKWVIDLNVTAFDFYSPKMNKFSSFKENMAIGPDFSLTRLSSKTGLGISANIASPSISFLKDNAGNSNANKYLVFAGPGLAYNFQNQYLIPSKSPVAPFIFANALASVAQIDNLGGDVKFGFGIPVGAGFRFKIADQVGLNIKAGYAFGITEYYESNIFWSAGASLGLNKKSKEEAPVLFIPIDTDGDGIADEDDDCPEIAGLPELKGCPDTDGDGIADKNDECPKVAGLVQFNGCEDRDGDGIADNKDECPDVAGLAKFNGCPEPDTDGDGIVDSKDECPNVAGLASLNGCPDRDGDGVADIKDKCPDVAGPVSNKGCPEVEQKVKERLKEIAGTVKFETGKSVLAKNSYKLLDEVVTILNNYPAYSVSVEGYTDSTGSDAINDKLSNERAKVCADYILSKEIAADRVSSVGFGSKNPIADNKTAAGRAKNRRTEFNLSIKD